MSQFPRNLISGSNAGSSLGADAFGARYDHDQLPVSLTRETRTSQISYGPDGERTRQTATEGNWTWVGAFERSVVGAASERRVYLGNHTQLSTRSGATGVQVSYLLTDRLGSVDAIADASGTLRETRGYDAFGKPRQGTWADANTLPSVARTTKGFTQHAHLDGQRLIHMNGRAYDYQLGRFLSVDPVIQFPENSQSLNPYSYILNNPLSGTDPTGFKSVFGSLCSHASNFNSSGTCGNGLAVLNNLESGGRDRNSERPSTPENGGTPGSSPRSTGGGFARSGAADVGRTRSDDRHRPGMDDTTVLPPVPAIMPSQEELSSYDTDIWQHQVRQANYDRTFQQFKQEQGQAARGFVVTLVVTGASFAIRPDLIFYKTVVTLRRAFVADDIAVVAAGGAARGIALQIAKVEKQLAQHGRGSVEKSLRSLEKRLAEHRQALETYRAQGGYTSSVEREIRAFESEIQAIKDVLGRGP